MRLDVGVQSHIKVYRENVRDIELEIVSGGVSFETTLSNDTAEWVATQLRYLVATAKLADRHSQPRSAEPGKVLIVLDKPTATLVQSLLSVLEDEEWQQFAKQLKVSLNEA